MTAEKYLEENSDWFDKSPGGEKLYFESEVIKMMENYSSQTERMYSEEQLKLAYMQGYNRGVLGTGPDMESYIEFIKQNKKD